MNLIQYKEKLNKAVGKRDYIKKNLSETELLLKELGWSMEGLEEAQTFLQDVAQQTQNQLKFHIKDIVQLCIDNFWEGEISFDLEFDAKRGKTECSLKFVIDGEEVSPIDAEGGGLVDISSFGLRIASWSLGNSRNTIVLDEPFKFLSIEHRERASNMLKELSDKLSLQFIIVTHDDEITSVADKVFKVSRNRKDNFWKSKVEVLKGG
jgi:DNA repair exonuclease SbcCD ATPase subunit